MGAADIAGLVTAGAAVLGLLIVIPRYLARIARLLVTYADLPEKVEENTRAIRRLTVQVAELVRQGGA